MPGGANKREERKVNPSFRAALAAAALLAAAEPASAEKSGGVLRMPLGTSPASMSIHEESTIATLGPMMGVFNNLVMFDQHVPQNSLNSIVPDLASSWSWSEDGKELTFKLGQGVKWHDGKPFTARRQVHLGNDRRNRGRKVPGQSAQILVSKPRFGHD